MPNREIVSEAQWVEARRALLVEEKAWTRDRDRLVEKRRALPRVGVGKNYTFEGAEGALTLADLFDGRGETKGGDMHDWMRRHDRHETDGRTRPR